MQMRDDNEQREFRLEKKIETFFLVKQSNLYIV
jgi:hypothetical protein